MTSFALTSTDFVATSFEPRNSLSTALSDVVSTDGSSFPKASESAVVGCASLICRALASSELTLKAWPSDCVPKSKIVRSAPIVSENDTDEEATLWKPFGTAPAVSPVKSIVIFGGAVAADTADGTANDATARMTSRMRFTGTPQKWTVDGTRRQSLGHLKTGRGERDPTPMRLVMQSSHLVTTRTLLT